MDPSAIVSALSSPSDPGPHSDQLSFSRPSSMSRCINQDMGAMLEYQGQTVSFEWQSKQARWASSLVAGEFQAGSATIGGLSWSRPYGTNWARTRREPTL